LGLIGKPEYYHVVLERFPPRPNPPFEDPAMQERVWGRRWGCRNDVGTLRVVLVHRPGNEMRVMKDEAYDPDVDALVDFEEQWYFRDRRAPNLERMQKEHDHLVEILRQEDVQVEYVDGSERDPKAIYTRDCAIVVDGGAIICRMGLLGKEPGTGRRGEEFYVTQKLSSLGMPILKTIHGSGLFEGGSFCFLNRQNAAVGMGFRQNEEGARQVEEVLAVQGVKITRVPLTGYSLHLDGCVMMVDHDLALVNVLRLPYWFIDLLKGLGIRMINVDSDEARSLNCLTIRPGRVIFPAGNPRTAEKLDKAGVAIIEADYSECSKAGGVIHCSTLPLVRDDD
jgi:N-dimethylarginine dimethylaminohydrolase